MAVIYLTAYSKRTEIIAAHHQISDEYLSTIRQLLNIADDYLLVGCYPLQGLTAKNMAAALNIQINTLRFDWFLESIAD